MSISMDSCWAKHLKCISCKEKGHVRAACPKRSSDKKAVDARTVKVGRCIVGDLDPDRLDDVSKLKARKAENSHLRGGKGERDI